MQCLHLVDYLLFLNLLWPNTSATWKPYATAAYPVMYLKPLQGFFIWKPGGWIPIIGMFSDIFKIRFIGLSTLSFWINLRQLRTRFVKDLDVKFPNTTMLAVGFIRALILPFSLTDQILFYLRNKPPYSNWKIHFLRPFHALSFDPLQIEEKFIKFSQLINIVSYSSVCRYAYVLSDQHHHYLKSVSSCIGRCTLPNQNPRQRK